MSGNVCWLDTETTGLDPVLHEIWEVGLVLPDGTEHEWQLPVDLSWADPMALTIGRFRIEVDGPGCLYGPADFATEFVRLTRGLHLCGVGVSFDAERLWRLLRKNGECPMWHYHLIDVKALAAGYLAGTRRTLHAATVLTGEATWVGTDAWRAAEGPDARPPWDSNELSRAIGVDPNEFDRHTALGDARWAKAMYEAVMGS